MENRQPTYPGRVILTPVPGQENTYDMIRADEPTVEGTPLNKATLLQDATCAILDIPNTSVPNDAFLKLALGIGKFGYFFHVTMTDGRPAEGVSITGITSPTGAALVTDENGEAVGVSNSESISVTFSHPWSDIQTPDPMTIASTGIMTVVNVALAYADILTITQSTTLQWSRLATSVDLCAVGGGGGGGYGADGAVGLSAGAGGGGGYVSNALNVPLVGKSSITVTVGAGGTQGIQSNYQGGTGGSTVFQDNLGTALCTAPGGVGGNNIAYPTHNNSGGAGNGNGGNVQIRENGDYATITGGNGAAGSVSIFGESGRAIPGGGGGGGTCNSWYNGTQFYSGSPGSGAGNGGKGGTPSTSVYVCTGISGLSPGGGGGGGSRYDDRGVQNVEGNGGAGGAGAAYVRFHHDATATQNEEDSMNAEFTVNGNLGWYP